MIARKTLLIVINNVIGGLLGFISIYFIASRLGAESLGILGFGLSFVGMFTFLSNLGFDTAHNKHVAGGHDLGACVGTYIHIKLRLTGIMFTVSLAAILIYGYLLGGFESTKQAHVTFIFLIYYVIWALSLIAITTFNARRNQAKSQIPSIMEFLTRTPLIIFAVLLGYDIVSVAVLYVLGLLVLMVVAFHFLRGVPRSSYDPELAKSYRSFAAPMAAISLTTSFALYLDKVMIATLSDTFQVGLYFGAQRIVVFIIAIAASLAILIFPTISDMHSRGEHKQIRDMLMNAERYLALSVMPIIAVLVALGGPIMSVFGGDYTSGPAGWTLVYLSIFGFLFIMNKPIIPTLAGTDNPRMAMNLALTIAAINVVMNLILIPGWSFLPDTVFGFAMVSGALGASVAICIGEGVNFIGVRLKSRGLVGYRLNISVMSRIVIAGLITGALVNRFHHGYISGIGLGDSALVLALEAFLGLGVYLLLVVAMRVFGREELAFYMDLIDPMAMGRYIKDEIRSGEGKD